MVKNDNLWLKFNQSMQCVVQLMVMQLVPITTDVVGSTPAQGEEYNIM
jgi:hypothetical protein